MPKADQEPGFWELMVDKRKQSKRGSHQTKHKTTGELGGMKGKSLWFARKLYRHTSVYCASLYCAVQILCFSQIEGLWQPYVKQVYQLHFSSRFR